MTAARPSSSHPLTTLPRQRRAEPALPHRLRLCVHRPRPDTAVVTAVGELDSVTAPRLAELLTHRLRGTLHRVVVDLSEVDTLDAEGASVLAVAGLLARNRGIQFDLARGAGRRETRPLTAAPPQRKQDR